MATTVGGEFKVHGLVSLEATKSHHPELREKEASIQTTEQQGSQFEPHTSMQATFDKIVCHELGTPFRYRKVAVLIVHWAEYLDRDLQCGREVKELNDLFTDDFKFHSQVLTLHDKQKPQLQLNHAITKFVFEHNGSCRTNLLIIYYTGHGIATADDGLDITGVRQAGTEGIGPNYDARANWNQAEQSLHEADADVLTIVDSCSAGSVMKGATNDSQIFELLAATGRRAPTAGPGPRSFTRAMIDSLKDQLSKNPDIPFTTYDLNQAIMKRRKNDTSQIFNRNSAHSHRFIKLAPLDEVKVESPIVPKDSSYLSLRFVFKRETVLSNDQIARLAKQLSTGALNSETDIRAIEWLDYHHTRDIEHFAEAAALIQTVKSLQKRWKARIQSKKTLKRKNSDASDQGEPALKRLQIHTKRSEASRKDTHELLSPSPSESSNKASPS